MVALHRGRPHPSADQANGLGCSAFRLGRNCGPCVLDLARDAANGVIYPTHFSPATSSNLPAAQAFIELVRKTYNKPPDYVHAQAFDAINIAIAAIERASKADRTAVRNALRQTDHQSVRGPFKFDQKGDPTLVTHMVRIVDIKETDARS
jgi:branched-chain amino acid transport system substrate-binding protein